MDCGHSWNQEQDKTHHTEHGSGKDGVAIGNSGKLHLGYGAASTLEAPAARAAFREPQSISFLHAGHGSRILAGQESVGTLAVPEICEAGPAVRPGHPGSQ